MPSKAKTPKTEAAEANEKPALYLRTFGVPELRHEGRGGERVSGMRLDAEDLALLVYFCVESARTHGTVSRSRSKLAALLERQGKTNLREGQDVNRSLSRIRSILPSCINAKHDPVKWMCALPCDAADLLRLEIGSEQGLDLFDAYEEPFLSGWDFQYEAREFEQWASLVQMDLEERALLHLERWGSEAESRGDWLRAREIGLRMAQISYENEKGHRRMMRALHELGQTPAALKRYRSFRDWLQATHERKPDAHTQALAQALEAAQ